MDACVIYGFITSDSFTYIFFALKATLAFSTLYTEIYISGRVFYTTYWFIQISLSRSNILHHFDAVIAIK